MKNKKKCFILMMLTATLLTNIVIGATEISTLNYLEIDIIGINGERELIFNNSDTGTDEISFLWRIYDPSTNITVYMIKSQEISYDQNFINNTKNYIYIDNNTGEQFSIAIDYSSIDVPESLFAALNETISRQAETITGLQNELDSCYLQIDALNQTITNIQTNLTTWMTAAEQYQIELEEERNLNIPLNEEITQLNIMLSNATNESIAAWNRVNDLEGELSREQDKHELTKNALNDASDMFAVGYQYQGEDRIIFNLPNIMIGFFVSLFIMIYYGDKIKSLLKQITGKEIKQDKSKKVKRGLFAKSFGLKDARDYDEIPITDHPTLQKWREVKTDPVVQPLQTNPQPVVKNETIKQTGSIIKPTIATKNIDDVRKNIDLALNNKDTE